MTEERPEESTRLRVSEVALTMICGAIVGLALHLPEIKAGVIKGRLIVQIAFGKEEPEPVRLEEVANIRKACARLNRGR